MEYFERGEFNESTVGKEWNIRECWRKIRWKFYITGSSANIKLFE